MRLFKQTLLVILSAALITLAQTKELTLRDVTTNARSFFPKHLVQLEWRPSTEAVSFIDTVDGAPTLTVEDIHTNKKESLVSLSTLNQKMYDLKFEPLLTFPQIKWLTKDSFQFWQGDTLLSYNVNSKTLDISNTVNSGAENIDVADIKHVAYTIKNNLYIAVNEKQIQITKDDNPGIVNGQYVSRNEFGIFKGTFWSPKNNYLAFYRKDESKVTDYPLVDITSRPAKVEDIKYPMAGMTSEEVTLGVYDLKTEKTIFLKTGEHTDHYLTGITWDPNEKYIYIGILNRDQNHLEEIKYDIATGDSVETLFEERNPKYVQPLNGLFFVKDHPDEFLWLSRRDGWNHFYLYNTDGKLIKQLTKGDWEVTEFNGFDEKGANLYYTSTMESPLDRDLYKVNLKSGKIAKLTPAEGVNYITPDENGKYFIDSFNNLTTPNNISVIDGEGKEITSLLTSPNPIKDFAIGTTKIFKLKSKDGFDLYCRMILPAKFDSTKKYPVLVYVYGGPGIQLIRNGWLGDAGLWLNYMAEHGYVVFTLDNRGSANRGLAFEQVTFRHLGTNEIQDQELGVNYLKSLPFVDTTKLGVFGWSFGGFMTTSLMTRTPGLFKVAVAGGSVINWKYYEVMYTERYMDTPQANPEGYEQSNLLNYVKNLKGKLLMIHGTMDPIVVWQHDLMFIKKCADLGVPVDYFVYPGQQHGVTGIDTYHLYDKITNYFKDFLIEGK
ncbi:MAG TPA: DPP IV N-terminal domain-containing protein [Ignavibacteriaceae bacterium]|nr:DPP IV N-terminal domain-containing protein [Ignavibacteriaceae bacterium]